MARRNQAWVRKGEGEEEEEEKEEEVVVYTNKGVQKEIILRALSYSLLCILLIWIRINISSTAFYFQVRPHNSQTESVRPTFLPYIKRRSEITI